MKTKLREMAIRNVYRRQIPKFEFKNYTGDEVRTMRKTMSETVKLFAERLGISHHTLKQVEMGNNPHSIPVGYLLRIIEKQIEEIRERLPG